MKRILVLPATQWQVPLMKKIKMLGYMLYVVNPIIDDKISGMADGCFESDIFAFDDVVKFCEKNEIDVALSDECDIATVLIAKINEKIGGIGTSEKIGELFTDKYLMRSFSERQGFPSVPYKLCKTVSDVKSFYEENKSKIIMKPVNSNASHGVYSIDSEEMIEYFFDDSMGYAREGKGVIAENYIEGTEYTVDGIMTRHGHITLAISEKKHYKHNENVANSLLFTQYSDQVDYKKLREINDDLMNATSLPFGLTHVEYKYNDGDFYLIEMAARGGGNLISALIVPFMAQIDVYDYLIRCSLNEKYDKDIIPCYTANRCALLKFIDLENAEGVVIDILGEDYLRNEKLIKQYALNFKIGDYVKCPDNDSVRLGYYIICAESMQELNEVVEKVETRFAVKIG